MKNRKHHLVGAISQLLDDITARLDWLLIRTKRSSSVEKSRFKTDWSPNLKAKKHSLSTMHDPTQDFKSIIAKARRVDQDDDLTTEHVLLDLNALHCRLGELIRQLEIIEGFDPLKQPVESLSDDNQRDPLTPP